MLNSAQKAYIRHLVNKDHDASADLMTDEQFAQLVGVARKTLTNWKHNAEFLSEYEKRKSEFESSKDFFKVCLRDRALEEVWRNYEKAEGGEKRQYLKMLLEQTADVEVSDDTAFYGDHTDADLMALCLKRDISPLGMTMDELKTLAKAKGVE